MLFHYLFLLMALKFIPLKLFFLNLRFPMAGILYYLQNLVIQQDKQK